MTKQNKNKKKILRFIRKILQLSPCCGATLNHWGWGKFYCNCCGKRI